MKPTQKIDKSAVMKRAWAIFRGKSEYSWSFSESLKRAWFIEKDNIRFRAEQERSRIYEEKKNAEASLDKGKHTVRYESEMESINPMLWAAHCESMSNYYGVRGMYYGD